MRIRFGLLLSVLVLTSTPALAGNLTFTNGKAAWASATCVKPTPAPSVLQADRETAGNSMNALIAQHNAFIDAAQAYMDCVNNEAGRDGNEVARAINAGAQQEIATMHSEVEQASAPLRAARKE